MIILSSFLAKGPPAAASELKLLLACKTINTINRDSVDDENYYVDSDEWRQLLAGKALSISAVGESYSASENDHTKIYGQIKKVQNEKFEFYYKLIGYQGRFVFDLKNKTQKIHVDQYFLQSSSYNMNCTLQSNLTSHFFL